MLRILYIGFMKRYAMILLAALMVVSVYAQDTKKQKQPTKFNGLNSVTINDITVEYNMYKGRLNGPYKEIKNKEVVAEGFYVNNKAHSTWTSYYANGQKWAQISYVEGAKHGTWRVWNSDGTLQYEYGYQNGKPTGTWKEYNPNGDIVAMIQK